jgi:acyl carrier protein
MEIEEKLREMLLPVLGLDTIEEVKPGQSLVKDLDADSIDFVEIIYLIEQNFGVVLKANEMMVGGINPEEYFSDGKLTREGAELINKNLAVEDGKERYIEGMTKIDLFSAITVRELGHIIKMKMAAKGGA